LRPRPRTPLSVLPPGREGPVSHQRTSRFSSNDAEPSSARKLSIVVSEPSSNACARTPTVLSEWNGTSTCGCDTRLTDVESQTGQRTATAAVSWHGASNRDAEGVTGTRAASRPHEKPHGHSPLPIRADARDVSSEARSSRREVIRLTYVSRSSGPSGAQSSASWPTCPTCSPPHAHAKTTRYTAGCAGPGNRSIWRNDDNRTRVVEAAAGQPRRYVQARAAAGP